MAAWQDWVPVWTGFSVDPSSVVARFIEIDKLVIAILDSADGTSDATGFTVTLPVAAKAGVSQKFVVRITDNGINPTPPGLLATRSGSAIADVLLNLNFAAFTASGGKKVQFVIPYEAE